MRFPTLFAAIALSCVVAACSSQSGSSLPQASSTTALPPIVANPASIRGTVKKPNTKGVNCDDSNSPDVCVNPNDDSSDSSDDGDGGGGGGTDGGCTTSPNAVRSSAYLANNRRFETCDGGGAPAPTATPATTKAAKIYANALKYVGYNSKSMRAKIGGTTCAYMVNMITQPVTGITLSNSVPQAVLTMNANPGTFQLLSNNATAQAGDIVVKDGNGADPFDASSPAQSHIGICGNAGCTQIYSNSDSSGSVFKNNYSNGPSMDGYPSTIYHVKG